MAAADRNRLLGVLQWEPVGDDGAIRILNGWEQNVIIVEIPQIRGVEGAPADCRVPFHHKAAGQGSGKPQGVLPVKQCQWGNTNCVVSSEEALDESNGTNVPYVLLKDTTVPEFGCAFGRSSRHRSARPSYHH